MVCIVTGSSRGLGKAIALAFGRRKYKVVVLYKDKSREAENVASQIEESIVFRLNVRDFNEIKILLDAVIKKWGRVDILVNSAGITKEALLLRTSEKDFEDIVAVNLKGPFHFIRAVSPYMMKQKCGHIINVSSIAGIKGKAGLSAYSASKAGLIGLTLTTALELGRYNIMVNAVMPGYMITDMGTSATGKSKETAMKASIVKKFSNPETTAEFICYLSDTSGVTGQIFNLDSRII
ncbi:MAG: SDR family NAD(P)-dependent oxidoreductase [Thermodesulfovibrionia bacterium]|nr:SDR family NAD(P)-dependent oxidoreductase [Thermodesulfovibrionia bacterium]